MSVLMSRWVHPGTTPGLGRLYAEIHVTTEGEGRRLSISGVEGPLASGDCRGSCDQCLTAWPDLNIRFAPGWDRALLVEFVKVWDRWHLNDMRAGSPHQESWLRGHPEVSRRYPDVLTHLAEAGLHPDESMDPPYKYGSAWLREDLPLHVIDFLAALPEPRRDPPEAWGLRP